MDFVESKKIFLLMKDILKMVDQKVINHGYRVAYIMSHMLHCKGGYEPYELADIALLATFHDIGAYKTDRDKDFLQYETKETAPHSIYGYLFFKYLSPQEERASAILSHHTDYNRLPANLKKEIRFLAACLNVAECVDLYHDSLKEQFNSRMFEGYKGTKLSEECLQLFYAAIEKHDILSKLRDDTYLKEMDELLEYMIFSNEEIKQYLGMLVYSLGFVEESIVVDTVTRICISQAIGSRMLLNNHQMEVLYYGAMLCDVGMLGVDKELIDAPRKLNPGEMKKLQSHVRLAERAMENSMSQEVVALISTHHERGDGSGYPRRIKDAQMNDLQRILQVADVMTALLNDRPWRKKKEKNEIMAILISEKETGRMSEQVVDTIIAFYEDIYQATREREEEVLSTYRKLLANYETVKKSFQQKAEK